MQNQLRQAHLEDMGEFRPAGGEEKRSASLCHSTGRVLSYIEQHYAEDISLIALSREFHFNPIYINRVLKRETGYTVMEIVSIFGLTERRVCSARRRIPSLGGSRGRLPDQRYFSQIFKKVIIARRPNSGHSPR
jgi:YesN/AraC family two-component response regulator